MLINIKFMENTNDFLPPGYEPPKSNANYMKFEEGDGLIL